MNTETIVTWASLGILLIVSWFALREIKKKNYATNRPVVDVNNRKEDAVRVQLDPKTLDVVRVLNEMQRAEREERDK
jgi:hypothetical protein